MESDVRGALLQQADQLGEIKVPEGLEPSQKTAVSRSIGNSFVGGFRVVTLISAVLAVLSSVVAWLLIPGKVRED